MKKTLIVLALAVALTFVFTAAALADHSPTFYVSWDPDSSFTGYVEPFGNAGTGSPHQNYLEGTEKCGVCHSVHRAPVPGVKWDTNPSDPAAVTPVAGGQYDRQEFEAKSSIDNLSTVRDVYDWQVVGTQMLLSTSVANSCDYCHISTAIGGDQLYAGKPQYRGPVGTTVGAGAPVELPGGWWNEGFGHSNACTGCHAVHGVSSNYGNVALYGQYGTFQGPIKSKILKVRAKGSGGAVGSPAEYVWQDETIVMGSKGQYDIAYAYGGIGAGAPYYAWSWAQTADDTRVDPLNVPLFPSATDAINGTNVRPDATAYDAQSGVFCTFCHQNYGYASEATVNPNGNRSLFQGPWYALAGTVPYVTGTAGDWVTMNGSGAYRAPFKNHPVKAVYDTTNSDGRGVAGTFNAAGKSATVPDVVAFKNASTCVDCHDAGQSTGANGVLIQSYPHFTPGYFHFVMSGANVGAAMTNAPPIPSWLDASDTAGLATVQAWLEDELNYEHSTTVQDGQCIKCHVEDSNPLGRGVGKTF